MWARFCATRSDSLAFICICSLITGVHPCACRLRNLNNICVILRVLQTSFRWRASNSFDSCLTRYVTPTFLHLSPEMPLGGKLERLDEDVFAVYVPRVAVFDFFVEPRLECYVTHETEPVQCVKIVSRSCKVGGSDFAKSLNRCFDFHVETTFTWPTGDSAGACEPFRTCQVGKR